MFLLANFVLHAKNVINNLESAFIMNYNSAKIVNYFTLKNIIK